MEQKNERTGERQLNRPPERFDDRPTTKQLRISDILFAVKKRIILIVAFAIIGLVAGIVLSIISYMKGEVNKQYAITTALAVTSQDKNGLFMAQSSNPDQSDIYLAENMVDSVIFVLTSDRTLDAAVERLELLGVSTKDIANNLTLSQYNETQIIQITLYWRSAQEGIEILNAINEVAPDILIDTLKIGGVSVINAPKSKYLIGGNINASMWIYMMVMGVLLGIGVAVLELLIHPTLLKSADMEKTFKLEVLGEIPERRSYFKKKKNLLIANEDEDSAILDNYASLCHIIKKRMTDYEHPCVYVTSSSQSEGKTTVTAMTAVQLADMGLKVLLIDFDTHNPKLGGMFISKVEYKNSLNALYRGEIEKEDAVTHLTGNLDILPAVLEKRPLPFDDALLELIGNLKNDYDIVLIDTAPVGQVADTMSLNLFADFALFVVRFDGAALDVIRDTLTRLDKSGTSIIGCVVNGVKEISGVNIYGAYGRGSYGKYGRYGRYSSHYRSSRPYRKKEKTEQEKEWEQWEKDHSEHMEDDIDSFLKKPASSESVLDEYDEFMKKDVTIENTTDETSGNGSDTTD